VPVVDTTGAGDTFVGATAARLAAGATIDEALDQANLAAALSVQRPGAGPASPTLDELFRGTAPGFALRYQDSKTKAQR
jgi:ribokinase